MNDFLTWLRNLAKMTPDAIAHPIHQWHRDKITGELLQTMLQYNHEERMEIYKLMQICECNGTMTPYLRNTCIQLLLSTNPNASKQLFLK